jgi:glutamate transport system permease protein
VEIIRSHFGDLLAGLGVTLGLTAIGYVGALVLGTVLAVFRVSPVAPLRAVGTVYVEFFRNIPLLSLLVLFTFGLPDVGVTFGLFTSAAICLALASAAYVCEAVRGGINAVPVGQAEAARAIGLTFGQSLRQVILPQAFRTMVQPLVNVFIGVVIGSSLAAAVGVSDLTNRAEQLNLRYAAAVPTLIAAGVLYVAVALLGGWSGGLLERRTAIRRGRT